MRGNLKIFNGKRSRIVVYFKNLVKNKIFAQITDHYSDFFKNYKISKFRNNFCI